MQSLVPPMGLLGAREAVQQGPVVETAGDEGSADVGAVGGCSDWKGPLVSSTHSCLLLAPSVTFKCSACSIQLVQGSHLLT